MDPGYLLCKFRDDDFYRERRLTAIRDTGFA